MWPPFQLPEIEDDLREAGLALDPRSLSDLTGFPMNAVINLGGCTASFVSPDGLIVTNHHCAQGAIQYNSTEQRNLLQSGFLAREKSEELPAGPGTRVLVAVAVEDATERMLAGLDDKVAGRERYDALEKREKELVAACERDAGHRCNVGTFFGGLRYFLVKQLEIRDVRLVYAPADGVGNYGGEVDNWMWPRHTGDFSFYRAWVAPSGKPADHDAANVPYRPAQWLRVARSGLAPGDFVMVAGYPGNTNRHRLASEVENAFEWYYPTRRARLLAWRELIDRETAERPDAKIEYASRVAGLENSIKNYQGMLDSYTKSDIVLRKQALERELAAWVAQDPARKARYGDALADVDRLVARDIAHRERDLYYGMFLRGSDLYSAARTLVRLSREREKPDAEREPGYQERDLQRVRDRLTRMDRTFDPRVDRASWRQQIVAYATIPPEQHVPAVDAWFGIRGTELDENALDARLEAMFGSTELGDSKTRLGWLSADRKAIEASADPFLRCAVALYDDDRKVELEDEDLEGSLAAARPRLMEGLIAFRKSRGEAVYPDANGTLRVTYGKVGGYAPRDGLVAAPFTTLAGILEKDTGTEPFNSPANLLQAIRTRHYGSYADSRIGSVPVNFLSDVDTTGGNSGSPTLNAKGELVGLLFDGTYESIISDWDYMPERTRSIHVDMRYALWVMDQVDGAQTLVREMRSGRGASSGSTNATPANEKDEK
jgi:hypothetical protein